jgi:hypothetical protein
MRQRTLAEWRANPELRQQIVQAAHRQRNEAIGRLFARLLAAPPAGTRTPKRT